MHCKVLSSCLACGGSDLYLYLDLGQQPLANSFHTGDEQPSFPLGAQVCKTCWHSQLTHAVHPDLLFKNYLYASGTTTTLRSYLQGFVDKVENDFPDKLTLNVLELASNDGTLLEMFKDAGHHVQGVDPAKNLRRISEAKGVPTYVGYWDQEALSAVGGSYDVIVAMNVLAHTADPLGFLQLCHQALKTSGVLYVQTSQAHMLRNGEFDTVYHEHHSFFTSKSFGVLAQRAGFAVRNIQYVSVHGWSYLVEMVPVQGCFRPVIEDEEKEHGYFDIETYEKFGARVRCTVKRVHDIVSFYADSGLPIIGYGAAAKGMTFLNAGEPLPIDCIVDDNILKVGKRTPGQAFPILGEIPEYAGPMLFLILAWNCYEEIIQRVKSVRSDRRDAFLTYFPLIKLIE